MMGRTLTIVIAILVAVVLYLLIHRLIVSRATKTAQLAALDQTKVALLATLQRLADERFITNPATLLSASVIPDGWGRGVMAFEFILRMDDVTDEQLPLVRQRLNHLLAEFCQDEHVESAVADGQSAFLVTDAWRHTIRVHLGVAYLVNEATIEYIQDLRRMDASQINQTE